MPDLDDHLDSRKGSGDVLRMRWSDRDGNTASVQASVERCDQVDPCHRGMKELITSLNQHLNAK